MFNLFGIKIADLSVYEALDKIEAFIKSGKKHLVVTANPEIILETKKNKEYFDILQSSSLVVADGAGLVLASYLYGQPILNGRLTGVDLVEFLIAESGKRGYSVFLAGSTNDILNKTTHYLCSKYSNINIVGSIGSIETDIISNKSFEIFNKNLLQEIQKVKPDILLLALGHPKQELWLYKNISNIPIKVGIGIGGAFDFLSGNVKRAPKFIRSLYLEWFWRLIIQPWRWRRIFKATVVFSLFVIIDLIKKMFHVEQK